LNPSAVPDFCWPYLEPEGEFITLAEEKTGLLKSEFRSIGKHSLGVPELVALSATYYYYLIDVSFLALATPADVLFGRENKTMSGLGSRALFDGSGSDFCCYLKLP
jgi:hypothetical protein